ncbi:hypothetical protein C5B85_18215 [Pseudoclavibacter sp. AY1F1]|nr:hypothetical protein C5B85_18215 [Pseudoclavibacter sp. AY1F1]
MPSHVLPVGSLPLGGMKEELSVAYLHMLASATGLTTGRWSQDYDVRDVTLKSSVEYPDLADAGIDVQLKCTGQESVDRPDTIAWSVSARTLNKLRKTNRATPYLLCVLVTQSEPDVWLHPNMDGLLARSHMYYEWGHKFPALKVGNATQIVHLPKSNLLTPASLLELMEEASTWRPH